jgi:KDO2-lipid IV(A) lauroyltransferase
MRREMQDRVEYGLLRGVEVGLGVLPKAMARRLGGVLGGFVRSPLHLRREIVVSNLRLAFPEASEAWIAETTVAAYRHLGREVTAMLCLSALDAAAVRDLTVVPDSTWQATQAAFAEGRGVIFAAGHYGNWEMAAASLAARGRSVTAIAKGMRNRFVDQRIRDARKALGIEVIGLGEASSRVPKALAAEHGVGIVGDQDARRFGVFVPFFGVPASTHRGTALFALRTGAPLMMSSARSLSDGRYQVEASRIEVQRTGDAEADVFRITADIAAALERVIRVDPAQYFWFHKRWKTRPPGEAPQESPEKSPEKLSDRLSEKSPESSSEEWTGEGGKTAL